jgi:drug/metabolite transporter (DMT)-like permease
VDALLYGALCLIWGSTWLAIKIGLAGVPPFLGAGLRFLIATVIVAIVVAVRGMPHRLTRADRICILSTGLLVFWIDYAAVYWAEEFISSGLTAVLFSTMPLMTAVMSAYWTRAERLHPRKLFGIVVGVAGTVLLFWPAERLGVMQVLGMLSALLGSLCAAINLVTVKRHGVNTDSWVLNLFGMGLGTACLLAMSAATESWRTVVWTTANVSALAYLAVFGSVIAFSIYYFLLKRMDATALSLTTLVIPIVALTLGRIVLHETVVGTAVVGIVIVLAGVGVAIVPGRAAMVTTPLSPPHDDARAV